MNKLKLVAVGLTLSVAFSMTGCYFLPDEEDVLAAPTVKTSEVKYTTKAAEKTDLIKQIVNTGIISSELEYDVSFTKAGGTIKKIYVRAGQIVKKGDLICELNTDDLDYVIKEKELNVKKAKLDKQILQQKKASQVEIDRADVEIELLEMELQGYYDSRDNSKLYSKVGGTISKIGKGVSAGKYVNPGDAVVTIIDTTKLYLAVKPEDYTHYEIGTKMVIRIGKDEYDAEVFMIPSKMVQSNKKDEEVIYDEIDDNKEEVVAEGIDYQSDYIYVKFTGTPPENIVGNVADAILVQDKRTGVIAVSNSMIKSIDGEKIVYVLKDGKKEAQVVETGMETGSMTEIVSGLTEGDLVVIR